MLSHLKDTQSHDAVPGGLAFVGRLVDSQDKRVPAMTDAQWKRAQYVPISKDTADVEVDTVVSMPPFLNDTRTQSESKVETNESLFRRALHKCASREGTPTVSRSISVTVSTDSHNDAEGRGNIVPLSSIVVEKVPPDLDSRARLHFALVSIIGSKFFLLTPALHCGKANNRFGGYVHSNIKEHFYFVRVLLQLDPSASRIQFGIGSAPISLASSIEWVPPIAMTTCLGQHTSDTGLLQTAAHEDVELGYNLLIRFEGSAARKARKLLGPHAVICPGATKKDVDSCALLLVAHSKEDALVWQRGLRDLVGPFGHKNRRSRHDLLREGVGRCPGKKGKHAEAFREQVLSKAREYSSMTRECSDVTPANSQGNSA